MSTKVPIYLKRGSRRGKKEKLRDILSSDMISPPLGDFRHTIHIGSGGGENDLFGDLSFLQGKFHLLPGRQSHLPQRPGLFGDRSHLNRPASMYGDPSSPERSLLLKNAVSLPVIGGVQALTLPRPAPTPSQTQSQIPPPKPPRLHLDNKNLTLPRSRRDCSPYTIQSSNKTSPLTSPPSKASPDGERCVLEDNAQDRPYLSHASSFLSLHLDLGPSILDDVLQIMDNQRLGLNGAGLHGGRQGIFT
ncbi:cdc42 effector protein 2-like [Conger conger]|uniref:cdc42 effector protein 2-like n=1 Tax=Conger conger TaxID=82655 RepID=UPI002A5A6F83|nr:cdc42 effector protein 2-like [Conger conger]